MARYLLDGRCQLEWDDAFRLFEQTDFGDMDPSLIGEARTVGSGAANARLDAREGSRRLCSTFILNGGTVTNFETQCCGRRTGPQRARD
jgi:hypothetical protein